MARTVTGVFLLIALLLPVLAPASTAKAFDKEHKLWTEVLSRYQDVDGTVNYKKLKNDLATQKHHPFSRYLGELSTVKKSEYESWNRDGQIAFLINAYNALTWKLIVDHYPLRGIKDLGTISRSPWQREFFSLLEGSLKTLNPLLHEYLRPRFNDFRIHAAVNLASLSSPRLQPCAFVGDTLNAQLEVAFRQFVSDPDRNQYDAATGTLTLSKIFDWYEKDFEIAGGVLQVIEKYGPDAAKAAIKAGGKVRYGLYHWDLNESRSDNKILKIPAIPNQG